MVHHYNSVAATCHNAANNIESKIDDANKISLMYIDDLCEILSTTLTQR